MNCPDFVVAVDRLKVDVISALSSLDRMSAYLESVRDGTPWLDFPPLAPDLYSKYECILRERARLITRPSPFGEPPMPFSSDWSIAKDPRTEGGTLHGYLEYVWPLGTISDFVLFFRQFEPATSVFTVLNSSGCLWSSKGGTLSVAFQMVKDPRGACRINLPTQEVAYIARVGVVYRDESPKKDHLMRLIRLVEKYLLSDEKGYAARELSSYHIVTPPSMSREAQRIMASRLSFFRRVGVDESCKDVFVCPVCSIGQLNSLEAWLEHIGSPMHANHLFELNSADNPQLVFPLKERCERLIWNLRFNEGVVSK